MTSVRKEMPYYIDKSETCHNCPHYRQVGLSSSNVKGCTRQTSDHYGHVLLENHPICDARIKEIKFKRLSKW